MNNRPDKPSLQDSLTESTFQQYLEGYSQVVPQDLLEARGGKIRYALDTIGPGGRVLSTKYRLGGLLTQVDPRLRFIQLYNPYATGAKSMRRGIFWVVRMDPPANERLRLWYMPPSTKDEIIMFRKLLQQLENNEIKITKIGS